LKTLDHPIVFDAAHRRPEIVDQRTGLDAAEDGDAGAGDDDRPAADPVIGERRGIAVPRLVVERPIPLVAGLVEVAQE
jgi:hypothetical protein